MLKEAMDRANEREPRSSHAFSSLMTHLFSETPMSEEAKRTGIVELDSMILFDGLRKQHKPPYGCRIFGGPDV